jgi:hypothetical protein
MNIMGMKVRKIIVYLPFSGMTNNRLDLTEPITEKKIDNTVVKRI